MKVWACAILVGFLSALPAAASQPWEIKFRAEAAFLCQWIPDQHPPADLPSPRICAAPNQFSADNAWDQVHDYFRQWREFDSHAGSAAAQRFSDDWDVHQSGGTPVASRDSDAGYSASPQSHPASSTNSAEAAPLSQLKSTAKAQAARIRQTPGFVSPHCDLPDVIVGHTVVRIGTAEKRDGLRPRDTILTVSGSKVDPDDVFGAVNLLAAHRAADTIVLSVQRRSGIVNVSEICQSSVENLLPEATALDFMAEGEFDKCATVLAMENERLMIAHRFGLQIECESVSGKTSVPEIAEHMVNGWRLGFQELDARPDRVSAIETARPAAVADVSRLQSANQVAFANALADVITSASGRTVALSVPAAAPAAVENTGATRQSETQTSTSNSNSLGAQIDNGAVARTDNSTRDAELQQAAAQQRQIAICQDVMRQRPMQDNQQQGGGALGVFASVMRQRNNRDAAVNLCLSDPQAHLKPLPWEQATPAKSPSSGTVCFVQQQAGGGQVVACP